MIAHFVPCWWLICDGGYWDDTQLRLNILMVVGPLASALACMAWVHHEHRQAVAKAVVGIVVAA